MKKKKKKMGLGKEKKYPYFWKSEKKIERMVPSRICHLSIQKVSVSSTVPSGPRVCDVPPDPEALCPFTSSQGNCRRCVLAHAGRGDDQTSDLCWTYTVGQVFRLSAVLHTTTFRPSHFWGPRRWTWLFTTNDWACVRPFLSLNFSKCLCPVLWW